MFSGIFIMAKLAHLTTQLLNFIGRVTGDLRTSKIIRPFNLFYPFLWQFRMKQDMIWLIYAEKSTFHPTYKLLLYFASFMLKYIFAVLLTLKHFWYLRARNLYYSIMTLDMFMHLNHNLYTVVSPFTPWYRSSGECMYMILYFRLSKDKIKKLGGSHPAGLWSTMSIKNCEKRPFIERGRKL